MSGFLKGARRRGLRCAVAALWLACLARGEDNSQKVVEELRAIHAALDRLVQQVDGLGKTQQAILLLYQIQLDESRLAVLQTRDETMALQERDQGKAAGALAAAQSANSAVTPAGLPITDPDAQAAAREEVSNRIASTNRLLDQTRAQRAAIQKQMDALRTRIAALEKTVSETLR